MKKHGFIEMIEEGQVVIIYDDFTKQLFDRSFFPDDIQIDMNVVIENGQLIEVSPPSDALKQEIKELTEKLFVPFKERKKKR